ncbi:hypothetical protein SAMN05443507_12027 [Alicyclobacillus tolerans]|uniref:Uncharacterized protein n=1 Tax=Alicyclobacillus tolerans TaxID=90970 RepID=A0A1M6ULG5_9BACL|nr:hypothetical protein SAMN05443507_12027 [Alicyclobacillus montanus]
MKDGDRKGALVHKPTEIPSRWRSQNRAAEAKVRTGPVPIPRPLGHIDMGWIRHPGPQSKESGPSNPVIGD